MADIFNSKIGKIKKGSRIAIVIGVCAMILGTGPMYLYKKQIIDILPVLLIGIMLFVCGAIAVVIGIELLIVYAIKLGKKSDADAYTISKELDDPETVYIKDCSTYLTPNYIVTLSTNPRYIKYSDIVWVYEIQPAIQEIGQMTYLRIKKRNGKTVTMAETGAGKRGSELMYSIMAALKNHNPQIVFGYSPELKKKFRRNL